MSDKERGLYAKYYVQRIIGNDLVEVNDRVFVLNPNTDPGAKFALRAYKVWAAQHGYMALAQDIQDWLDSYED